MSLQKLIEKIRDIDSRESYEPFDGAILKLCEAAEKLYTFAEYMKLSHTASDQVWIMADEAITEADQICKE